MTDKKNGALGAEIKQLRTERGWTQADLADMTDYSQSMISSIERGVASPTDDGLQDMLDLLESKQREESLQSDKRAAQRAAKWIKAQRARFGLTQQELGREVGLTAKTMSRVEQGLYLPSSREVRDVVDVLVSMAKPSPEEADTKNRTGLDESSPVAGDKPALIRDEKTGRFAPVSNDPNPGMAIRMRTYYERLIRMNMRGFDAQQMEWILHYVVMMRRAEGLPVVNLDNTQIDPDL